MKGQKGGNTKYLKVIEQKQTYAESLLALVLDLSKQSDFEAILQLITSEATNLFNADSASVMMVNPVTNETIRTIYKFNSSGNEQQFHLTQTVLTGYVLHEKKSLLSNNIKKDTRFRPDIFKEETVHSVMCVPLKTDGIVLGCLLLFNPSGKGFFDETQLPLLEKMAAICAPFLNNGQKIREYFKSVLPDNVLLDKYKRLGLLGKSKPFVELIRTVESAAKCDVRVFLEGKTGTGKELIARAIHKLSNRNHQTFVAADCGAIPHDLIESELFGHVKGAFTGAMHDRKGLFALADKGTLFLDEIANLPMPAQTKLMRVLQENEIRPIGSNTVQKVDVRIIAASSSSLTDMIDRNLFREDLYYRLVVYPINIQSLYQRKEDIPLLATHFLEKHAHKQGKKATHFHVELIEYMKAQKWPGNIRQLNNFVERLVTMAPVDMLVLKNDLFPIEMAPKNGHSQPEEVIPNNENKSLKERVLDFEKHIILQTLVENDWNQSAAARILQMSESLIRHSMKKLNIVRPKTIDAR